MNQHFSLSAKMNKTQRRTLVSPWRMHCTYYSMPKGTSTAEVMLNSEKIKLVHSFNHYRAMFAVSISQAVSRLVGQSVNQSVISMLIWIKYWFYTGKLPSSTAMYLKPWLFLYEAVHVCRNNALLHSTSIQ